MGPSGAGPVPRLAKAKLLDLERSSQRLRTISSFGTFLFSCVHNLPMPWRASF